MREVEMMMILTDEPGWPGYNEIIDIFPLKRMCTGLDWEEEGGAPVGLGGGMCKNYLGILNCNEIIAGGLGWGARFWFVCVCVCVPKTPMHLLRPGDSGKSVLRVLNGSRGGS